MISRKDVKPEETPFQFCMPCHLASDEVVIAQLEVASRLFGLWFNLMAVRFGHALTPSSLKGEYM